MQLDVLGCSGGEYPGFNTTSFLVDRTLAIDAGALCIVLTADEQSAVDRIFVTHPHLDHVKGIALLADNLCLNEKGSSSVDVISTRETIEALRAHLFNDILWPDFTKIPTPERPAIIMQEISPLQAEQFGPYTVTACPVNHTVPAVGYLVRKGRSALLFSGDTGPTDQLWKLANDIDALIIDVSFPNALESLALQSRHLTPALLGQELRKTATPPSKILVTHTKLQYQEEIRRELAELPYTGIVLLRDGDRFQF